MSLCDINLAKKNMALHIGNSCVGIIMQVFLTLQQHISIPYESSMSQLPDDIFYIKLRVIDKLRGHNNCHNTGDFLRSIAGMTSSHRDLKIPM